MYRAWRQKIEAWLQENEKEEKQNTAFSSTTPRRQYSSRRSLENDSGKRREPVNEQLVSASIKFMSAPSVENEGKDGANSPAENYKKYRRDLTSKYSPTDQVPAYQRVYSDWKNSIDKTDVVGTMEAIAGTNCLNYNLVV